MKIFILDEASRLQRIKNEIKFPEFIGIGLDQNVSAHLKHYSESENLVVYNDINNQLAGGLRRKQKLDDVLFYCKSAFLDLIEYFEPNQKKCQLISLNGLLALNDSVTKSGFSDDTTKDLDLLKEKLAEQSPCNDVFTLAATHILNADKSVSGLVEQLNSCSVIPDKSKNQIDIESLLFSYQEKQEGNAKELNCLKKELKKSEEKNSGLHQEVTQNQQKIKNLSEENDLLIKQLHYVQELFEKQVIQGEVSTKKVEPFNQLNEGVEIYQDWLRAILRKAHKTLFEKNRTFRNNIKKDIKLLKNSDLFDVNWYLKNYPDVADCQYGPEAHYLLHGSVEAYNPSNQFHTLGYLNGYPDVAKAGMQPIIHFIKHGQFEGREPDPM